MLHKLSVSNLIFLLFLVASFIPCILAGKDYYKILGIPKEASEKAIKSAYRQLSKKYHPDKNQNDEEAHNHFIEIGEAYEVLSDPEKRRTYDQFGSDAFQNGGQGQGGPGGPGGPGGFHDPFDLFNQMFGGNKGNFGGFGGFGGGGFADDRRRKAQSIQVTYPLSLREYFTGANVNFQMDFKDTCDHCKGSGSEDGKVDKCKECGGNGFVVQVIRMGPVTQQMHTQCPKCHGAGSTIKNHCKKCHGQKLVTKSKEINVKVPAGAPRDFLKIVENGGDKELNAEAGDLLVQFQEIAQNNLGYRRRGNDLFRTEALVFKDAMEGGWNRTIPFFDPKRDVKISRKPGIPVLNKEIEKLVGFGMPIQGSDRFGDLYIDYVIIVPQNKKAGSHKFNDEL
ncbi:hypothetical protein TPHA_0G00630 [Tetrapisispora phaffii CBS 4417]|uniref:J domain-containing protein n=1 Tax=Tetrapisispora phaffii (strain ATCC 24235 / CBS 4417 / NBRC 1672 / NRRL Y-8282 / UCD 70-5) TaxID=1071381 RepID=G8BVH1_TETPH|nr:hypothetical protein TPHA_0G00630 [Tetrapisispora phaffii CBS 4417]CCE63899.1 hypothetical protein TPHA_0G00630 [Tetrapisispora phaffii CBS 4417]